MIVLGVLIFAAIRASRSGQKASATQQTQNPYRKFYGDTQKPFHKWGSTTVGIFSQNFNRPGPGVPKNAPKKKGIARYFEMLFRDFSTLWKASMLLSICMIPMLVVIFLLFAPLFDYFVSGNVALSICSV